MLSFLAGPSVRALDELRWSPTCGIYAQLPRDLSSGGQRHGCHVDAQGRSGTFTPFRLEKPHKGHEPPGRENQEGNGVDQSTRIRGPPAAGTSRMRGYATASGKCPGNIDEVWYCAPTTSNRRAFYFRIFIFINWVLLLAITWRVISISVEVCVRLPTAAAQRSVEDSI